MDGAITPAAAIATSISMGTALLAGVFVSWAALQSRDPAVSIFSGIAALLILLTVVASALFLGSGIGGIGLLKAALMLTGVFSAVGMMFGLVRGLRSG